MKQEWAEDTAFSRCVESAPPVAIDLIPQNSESEPIVIARGEGNDNGS